MNELKVNGKQDFMGFEIPIIEGGFGEGQKAILAKTIAEIHEMKLFNVNKLINDNVDEFEFGIDILDLKNDENFAITSKNSGLFTQNSLNASSNVYLLSEQGYMLLVGFMRTDKSKEIRKELRRNYFTIYKINDNQLVNVNSEEFRITSKNLLDTINNFRLEERKSKKEHFTFMRDIKNEIETLKLLGLCGAYEFVLSSYVDSQNKEQPCYLLTKAQGMMMLCITIR